ncbi:hypothetical protein A8924_3562 [Saccharopolyspora erythraea NRRL 2338]|uniref:DUF6545 domain-containing protein n=3 Tax=Saccharopolyspora erythraea TaxID=1836 RepID=A4FEH2_SACEN|nr:MAB_1171c family putative transporter [Saccharopolyspora erythraea]PFG96173.1 hypothetical protein A8924_3562 [Saccharopolyspora erythraea NRRL 2338]QRK92706.1 hypothetical protein JQX30_16255 [Saccharopolyspora erythraea]CAM02447.1 hypothetical protein SACE_3171 [Saccharopolyspora erythraea NRRL 2338]
MTLAALKQFGADALLVGAVALWIAILVRLPSAIRSPQSRRLLIAAIGIAGSVTVYLDPVTALLRKTYVFADSCGIFMNLWGVLSSAFILDFVLAAVARRRLWLVYGNAVLVSVALVVLDSVSAPQSGCVTSVSVPWYSPFWWILSAAHVAAVAPCTVLCARYARRAASSGPLRLGLRLLAAGFASSTFFWGPVIIGFLLFRPPWLGALFSLNIAVTTWLITAGVALPVILRALAVRTGRRSLRRLKPLWERLVDAAPSIALPQHTVGGLPRWSVDLRLYRRVIEIRDAILILRDYVGDDVLEAARAHVGTDPVPVGDTEAAVTACWLEVAIAAKASGDEPAASASVPEPEHDPSGDELASEIRFLEAVARAQRSESVRRFAERHRRSGESALPRQETW